jgi:hypothetical protein
LVSGELPNLDRLKEDLAPRPTLYPEVNVMLPDLASYDRRLEVVA